MATRTFPAILVMGQDSAERFDAQPDDICISIRAIGAPPPELPRFRAVLSLTFDDVQWNIPELERCLTSADADRVVAFVEQHRSAARLVVHCMAGVSRSRAVAGALAWCYGQTYPLDGWPVLNPHVFVEVINAYRRRTDR